MEVAISLSQVAKRLDVLISLELEKPLYDKLIAMSDIAEQPNCLGLSPSESAETAALIGKKTNYVTAALSRGRSAWCNGRGVRNDL